MRQLLLSLTALTIGTWAQPSLANGGGYSFGVTFTGTLAPFQAAGTEHVRIVDEKLDIDLRRTDASVIVRYTMKNLSGAPARVRFGFPVEAVHDDEYSGDDVADLRQARTKNLSRAIQQLRGYAVTAGGDPVKAEFVVEPFASGRIKAFPGSGALKDIAGWMVSEVVFPAGTPVTLEIRYSATYKGESTWVSDDVDQGPLSFVYRLSTGAVWNGPIERGAVTLRADGIPAEEVVIESPRERFVRDGDRWRWTFQSLEPTLADDITVRAVPGFSEWRGYDPEERARGLRGYLQRGDRWGKGHQRFKAKASSTLKPTKDHGFGAEHLAEDQPVAPWAEGVPGDGIGEWVELLPTTPSPLLALEITPGFASYKKPSLFEQNGRPSRVEIQLNDEHQFVATLGDSPYPQLIPVIGYGKPVSKVRITIREVRPGTRYADTCISGVTLYDLLPAKPEIRGAR